MASTGWTGLGLLREAARRARVGALARSRASAPRARSFTSLSAPRPLAHVARRARTRLSSNYAQQLSSYAMPPLEFDDDDAEFSASSTYTARAFLPAEGLRSELAVYGGDVNGAHNQFASLGSRHDRKIEDYYARLREAYGEDVELPSRELVREQLEREERVYDKAVEEYAELHRTLVSKGLITQVGDRHVKEQFAAWVYTLTRGLHHELHVVKRTGAVKRYFAPIRAALELIPTEILAVITLHKCVGQMMSMPGGVPYAHAARQLATCVRDEYGVIVDAETRSMEAKRRQRAQRLAQAQAQAQAALAATRSAGGGGDDATGAATGTKTAAAGEGEAAGADRALLSELQLLAAAPEQPDETPWPPPDPWTHDSNLDGEVGSLETKVASFLIFQLLKYSKVALTDAEHERHTAAEAAGTSELPKPVVGAKGESRHELPAPRVLRPNAAADAGSPAAAHGSGDAGQQLVARDALELAAEGEEPPPEGGRVGLWIQPAFGHRVQRTVSAKGRRITQGQLFAHPALFERHHSPGSLGLHEARFTPMVVLPLPWRGVKTGGFLSFDRAVARMATRAQLHKMGDGAEGTQMETVYRGLNVLAATPWQVDGAVLAVSQQLWLHGGNVAALPRKKPTAIPPRPDLAAGGSEAELRAWKLGAYRTGKGNAEQHSLACDYEIKLSQAAELVGKGAIYFPHNLDFRGRAYPMPPNLNHLGADSSRALLRFARSRPLGEGGLGWLLVHLANLCGMDKVSMADRRDWSSAQLPHILDSARNPVDGKRWWAEQDEPFQVLAACFELAAVFGKKEHARPFFESSLPVHMDGSCNGLQHYAALGRDSRGGEQVNLTQRPLPGDVYSAVAKVVIAKAEEDADAGQSSALLVRGHISRKVVKQTVMTSVYGVTVPGARKQIMARLQEVPALAGTDERALLDASLYLAQLTLKSLGTVFVSAQETQEWLGQVAQTVTKLTKEPMEWVTPLGMPVVQPYRKERTYQIKTLLQKVTLSSSCEKLPVDSNRQKTAFPPNYVHSLDASHMLLTAIACHEAGIEYAAVHDSYWTHAATVDQMGSILRDKFVELHRDDLLLRLVADVERLHPSLAGKLPPRPERGTLELDEVRKSTFFFH